MRKGSLSTKFLLILMRCRQCWPECAQTLQARLAGGKFSLYLKSAWVTILLGDVIFAWGWLLRLGYHSILTDGAGVRILTQHFWVRVCFNTQTKAEIPPPENLRLVTQEKSRLKGGVQKKQACTRPPIWEESAHRAFPTTPRIGAIKIVLCVGVLISGWRVSNWFGQSNDQIWRVARRSFNVTNRITTYYFVLNFHNSKDVSWRVLTGHVCSLPPEMGVRHDKFRRPWSIYAH